MPREYRKLTINDYEITKNGDVINKKTGRKVKPQINGRGYYRVSIGKKLKFVHRLVAEKYIPNPDNKPQVNHIDGNKLNNRVENLEWVNNQENHDHARKIGLLKRGENCSWSKLSQDQVNFIREHSEISSREMAKVFGISNSHVREIRRNESWRC
jgi:DNA-binding transcriptional regulator YiaG